MVYIEQSSFFLIIRISLQGSPCIRNVFKMIMTHQFRDHNLEVGCNCFLNIFNAREALKSAPQKSPTLSDAGAGSGKPLPQPQPHYVARGDVI